MRIVKKDYRFLLVLSFVLIYSCKAFAQAGIAKPTKPQLVTREQDIAGAVDRYAQQVLSTWQLPGMALALSVDNKVILSKGYGVKELRPSDGIGFQGVRYSENSTQAGVKSVVNNPGEPINSSTIFHIASVTKSFTATVMAQLVEEGKFKWTDTLKNLLPDFNIFNTPDSYSTAGISSNYVTGNMLVRDALLHSTGLYNEAGTYFGNLGYSREDTYKMLAYLKPEFSFRSSYSYNNISFMICQKLIEKYTGSSWEENIRTRIFKPLGMTASTMNAEGFAAAEDVATPHDYRYIGGGKAATPPLYGDEQALKWLTFIGPAGSICSNVEELVKYAQMHCNNGYIVNRDARGVVRDTAYIMPRRAMLPLHRGYTVVSQDSTMIRLYGLCWFVEQNNRYKIYFHTGTSWGMTALCFFVPENKIAGCLLLNAEVGANARYGLMRKIVDIVRKAQGLDTDMAERDYNREFWNSYKREQQRRIARQNASKKPKYIAPPKNNQELAGLYRKDVKSLQLAALQDSTDVQNLFGDIIIRQRNNTLYYLPAKYKDMPQWEKPLKHKSGTTYTFRSDGHAFEITFNIENGRVVGLTREFGNQEENSFGGWYRVE